MKTYAAEQSGILHKPCFDFTHLLATQQSFHAHGFDDIFSRWGCIELDSIDGNRR